MLAKKINQWIMATLSVFSVLLLCGFMPYTPDADTVLIDHFDGATGASILAYQSSAGCGTEKPSTTPSWAYGPGPDGLSQALGLNPPAGEPAGSAGTYLKYPGGQLLSQPNGTIEFWIYLTTYGTGLSLVSQGPFPGSCAGWTFGMGVTATGQLQAGAWAAFDMNSGAATVPLNTWTHVAASWGSAGAKLYINGVLVGSDANAGMPASGYGGSVLINYGTQNAGTRFDELRISNVQRTSFESAPPAINLLQNGSFAGNLNGWVVNPAAQTGTPPWTPLLTDGTGVTLHPNNSGFNGTILYQNLNITGIAGKTFGVSLKLTSFYSPLATAKTVAVWLTYVDGTGALQRSKVLNPVNGDIAAAGTVVTGSFVVPAGAQKIVKLELVKEDYGEFHADDVTLWADGVTANPTPIVTGLSGASGAYGTNLIINGQNFGSAQGNGYVMIGGAPVNVVSWSDTAITVDVASPARSGVVLVVAGQVESNLSQTFQVTSPYFAVDVVTDRLKVIQGQAAEFLLRSTFFNGFTTVNGIALQFQESGTTTLAGKASFTPVPIRRNGGVVLKIDTTGVPAGTYAANILADNGGQIVPAGSISLQVVTVSDIKFYEMTGTPSVKTYVTAKTISSQGGFYIYTEVYGSDGQVFAVQMGDTAAVLSEVPAATPILGVFKRFWGFDLYALLNGTTQLRATAPDGTFRNLAITVGFPTTSWVSSIGLNTAGPIANNRTEPIVWSARGTTSLGWVGSDTSGMLNFQMNFLDNLQRSGDNLSATSTFTLQNPPVDIGTAILYAQTSDSLAKSVVPLTTVNAPGTGLLSMFLRSLDSQAFAEMFKISFYGTDNQLKFVKDVYAMHTGNAPIPVGNIPPGTYKILFTPANSSVKPQWWPNAADISAAAPVVFSADATVGDIYLFAQSQPTGAAITLPIPPSYTFASFGAGTGSVSFTASDSGFVWSASSSVPWITITSGITGTGNGTVEYAVAANAGPSGRTGTITIGSQIYTVTQPGDPAANPLLGTWGLSALEYDQYGWYTESSRVTVNDNGTGTIAGKSNEHGTVTPLFAEDFTYTLTPNADGSYAFTVTTAGKTDTLRVVVSDNRNVALFDGTDVAGRVRFFTLAKIDTGKTYGNADLSGPYYGLGYEHNLPPADNPPDGNGIYMSISSIETFDGGTAGTYNYFGRANSIRTDGAAVLWNDPGMGTARPYTVNADGSISVQSGAFSGFLTGNGKVGVGGGSYSTAGPNSWVEYLFLKKGDKAGGYTTADLNGTWALATFGDHVSPQVGQSFSADFGSMTCDTAGHCVYNYRGRDINGSSYGSKTLDITVNSDGSVGPAPGSVPGVPYAAIGNDGNTILFNPGITDPNDTGNRRAVVGIRASNTSNLSGGKTFNVYTGSFFDGANYYVFVRVPDPSHAIGEVQVSANGQTASAAYNSADGNWILAGGAGGINLGTAFPTGLGVEVMVRDGAAGPWYRYQQTVAGGLMATATNLQPVGTIPIGPFSFVFTGVPGAATYSVHLFNPGRTAWIWSSDAVTDTSVPYTGTSLLPGALYPYEVVAQVGSNLSIARGQFTYGAAVSYTGYVADSQSTPQPVTGATIEQGGAPANKTTSGAGGLYTLGNLPGGVPFYLKFYKDETFAATYSPYMIAGGDVTADFDHSFNLVPIGRLADWGIDTGKGVIRARVRANDAAGTYIGGATVTCTSSLGRTYTVCYDDTCSPALTATDPATGRYVIKNVDPNDTVTVTTRKKGWNFRERVFLTQAGGVSQGRITGSPAIVKGDLNADNDVNLADSVLVLQVAAGMAPAGIRTDLASARVDVSGSGRLGTGDSGFILQKAAELRTGLVTGSNITLVSAGHPPTGFFFAAGALTQGSGDFEITGGDAGRAYGWLNGAEIADLGVVSGGIGAVTTVPGPLSYGVPVNSGIYLTAGRCYALHLANGNYAAIQVKSVTVIYGVAGQVVTMVFDYKYQSDGTRNF